MTDPTEAIDYSRPVGWWCPVCGTGAGFNPGLIKLDDAMVTAVTGVGLVCCKNTRVIPRYLPIPEGQRPLVEDEAESAEVVTLNVGGIIDWINSDGTRWTTEPTVEHINWVVEWPAKRGA